jgi:hypothetical protein
MCWFCWSVGLFFGYESTLLVDQLLRVRVPIGLAGTIQPHRVALFRRIDETCGLGALSRWTFSPLSPGKGKNQILFTNCKSLDSIASRD